LDWNFLKNLATLGPLVPLPTLGCPAGSSGEAAGTALPGTGWAIPETGWLSDGAVTGDAIGLACDAASGRSAALPDKLPIMTATNANAKYFFMEPSVDHSVNVLLEIFC
jgi:hypothetical protein